MYLCVRGVDCIEVHVPRQESEQSCICVLEVSMLLKCLTKAGKCAVMYLCVRGVEFVEVPVPRQKSEQSCICVLEVSILLKCLTKAEQ